MASLRFNARRALLTDSGVVKTCASHLHLKRLRLIPADPDDQQNGWVLPSDNRSDTPA
jgi:hypothetical protein